jgi:hypothetical protein
MHILVKQVRAPRAHRRVKTKPFFFFLRVLLFCPNGYDFPTLHVSRRFESRQKKKINKKSIKKINITKKKKKKKKKFQVLGFHVVGFRNRTRERAKWGHAHTRARVGRYPPFYLYFTFSILAHGPSAYCAHFAALDAKKSAEPAAHYL